MKEAIHWIQLSQADCYTARQLSSEVVPAIPSSYKIRCLQGQSEHVVILEAVTNILGMRCLDGKIAEYSF